MKEPENEGLEKWLTQHGNQFVKQNRRAFKGMEEVSERGDWIPANSMQAFSHFANSEDVPSLLSKRSGYHEINSEHLRGIVFNEKTLKFSGEPSAILQCLFQECKIFDSKFKSTLLHGEFQDCRLVNCNFHDSSLRSCIFRNTRFENCRLTKLSGRTALYENCIFVNCNFSNAGLGYTEFRNVRFECCNFDKAIIGSTLLKYCDFVDSDTRIADWEGLGSSREGEEPSRKGFFSCFEAIRGCSLPIMFVIAILAFYRQYRKGEENEALISHQMSLMRQAISALLKEQRETGDSPQGLKGDQVYNFDIFNQNCETSKAFEIQLKVDTQYEDFDIAMCKMRFHTHENEMILISFGPDRDADYVYPAHGMNPPAEIIYDPTNGTISNGDMILKTSSGLITPLRWP